MNDSAPRPEAPGRGEHGGLRRLHASWSTNPVASWLVEHGGRELELGLFVKELCERLLAQGVPLFGASLGIRSMHPEVFARNVRWRRGETEVARVERDYAIRDSEAYRTSPVRLINEGAGAIRCRIYRDQESFEFPILAELAALGCTDYVIMPIQLSTGTVNFISWTSDRPGGFSTADLTLLYDLLPLIALRVELESAYEATRTLLNTYLGREPGRRVLAGKVRRGQVEPIRAAIWLSDLRGFTNLADRLPPEQVVDLLDDFFETLARPIGERGGEVLKFMGDGMLAIFPVDGEPRRACEQGLDAALEALAALEEENRERAAHGAERISCGIGLHLGDVQFGNIGARDRLDFTVVGRAVNEVSRVEALCKALYRPLLTSAPFAAALGDGRLASLGFQPLRGLAQPQEIFGLPDRVRPPA